ncbi:DUF1367 family protein [Comamonas sp. lk]|uniref:DUF1367 family protein n=1 Tax=Comamonas sp. lk TaxID=2201272 RepID=UPI000EAC472F|nr:DUF1367 family protein [Comamonas sp. lk]
MSRLVITKGMDGKLCGLDEKGQRAYNKFKAVVAGLLPGQTLGFTFRVPRSPQHHAFFFLKLQKLLERTEEFADLDKLRAWVILGAGYADFVPGLDGKPNAIPKSMDFDNMDEAEFSELHRAVDAFLWTLRAQAILWPALNADQRWACMESFMEGSQR